MISLIYRPPVETRNIDDKLFEQIAEILCQNDCVIFGVFNLSVTKWDEPLNSHLGHDLSQTSKKTLFFNMSNDQQKVNIILMTEESRVNDKKNHM